MQPRLLLLGVISVAATVLTATGCGSATANLPAPQIPEVTVATPLVREVRDVDEYTGRTEAVQTVEVRARVSGYLKEIYFNDGDYVKQGDPLFLIDPRTYEAELKQAQARVELYEAKYNYARTVRARNDALLKSRAISQEEHDSSVAAELEALAARNSAEADAETNRLNLEFTKITSEIDGRIDRTYITRGNLVQSGAGATLLTRIVSVDPIYVYFNPDELAFLRYSQRRLEADGDREATHVRERKIDATITLADGTRYPEHGTVDFASNQVDPTTGTIQVRAVFPNSKRILTPGLFVRLHIAAEDAYTALLVPERAINTDQSQKFVYVVDGENRAQRKNVVLGTKFGKLRVIKGGLSADDRVIIGGGLLVRPGEPVVPQPSEVDASSLPEPPTRPATAPAGSATSVPSIPPQPETRAPNPAAAPADVDR
jgi:RND family efflux transporter MFP subunit